MENGDGARFFDSFAELGAALASLSPADTHARVAEETRAMVRRSDAAWADIFAAIEPGRAVPDSVGKRELITEVSQEYIIST